MIRSEKAHMVSVAATHPGMTGKNNEDRFAVSAFQVSEQNPTPVLIAVLCDGVGGHQAGEVAAEMAVEIISQHVADSDGSNPPVILQQAVYKASERIRAFAEENVDYQGMGSTCSIAWIHGKTLYTGTVGDSRIYLMRNHQIRQLSTDHTWVQEALDAGLLKPEDARGHPNAHIIRRYLGSAHPPELDLRQRQFVLELPLNEERFGGLHLHAEDLVLLCSDGLTDLVDDNEILETFNRLGMEEAAQALIELANQRGGHDNITLITIQAPAALPKAPRKPSRFLVVGCAVALVAALLLASIGLGLWWYGHTGITPTPTLDVPTLQFGTQPAGKVTARPPGATPSLGPTPVQTQTPTPGLPTPQKNGDTLTPWPTNTLSP